MQDFVILISLADEACQALARRLRAEGIYCRILPAGVNADIVLQSGAQGVILAGGSTGVAADLPAMTDYLQMGLPMLCLGDAALTLCKALGGEVANAEGGIVTVSFDSEDDLFSDVEDGEHYLPELRGLVFSEEQGTVCAAAGDTVVGLHVRQRSVYGLAFPLERNDPSTAQLLTNFCCTKCGCTRWWSERAFIDGAKEAILTAAGDGDALCALSGGVDSGDSALLGNLALGSQLHCIFVDTGLLREGEA